VATGGTRWLGAALDYLPRWIAFQIEATGQPGCSIAVAHGGRVVLDEAFGFADLARRERLTPRHRFRVASHSKSFAAAGILRLAEQRKLRLEDRAGRYVGGLHPSIARATLVQLLSHGAGVVRDGPDSTQFQGRRPFLDERELRADLAAPATLLAGARFKYSNHGYGLVGLVAEAVAGRPYREWLQREVIEPAGLRETLPDAPIPRGVALARGHSGALPLGRRIVLPGDFRTNAISPAAGVVSTAADLVRFYSLLSPSARASFLSASSRQRMLKAHWRETHSTVARQYGLGIMRGPLGRWDCFGHSGGLLGFITRTAVLSPSGIAVSVLANAVDGMAHAWLDGALRILKAFSERGSPSRATRGWSGRWWSPWGALDLVPAGDRVLVAAPGLASPLAEATEIRPTGPRRGVVAYANGYGSHGEPVRLQPGRELWIGGMRLVARAKLERELVARYGLS
jgi:CubicO group peptidase (beta-lactamase class C family)